MELLWGESRGETVALIPGAWNPPTRAHMALAEAASGEAESVVLVAPRRFPHKAVEGAGLDVRLEWLVALARRMPRTAAAVSDGGLFIELAREARGLFGARRILIVCGSDAAERIVEWEYGADDPIERQLSEYELLVASRGVSYVPPARLAERIHKLELAGDWAGVSSSEVRARIARGHDFLGLVPEEIAESVRAVYS